MKKLKKLGFDCFVYEHPSNPSIGYLRIPNRDFGIKLNPFSLSISQQNIDVLDKIGNITKIN